MISDQFGICSDRFAFACSACAPTAFGRPIWPVGPRFGSLGPFRGRFSRVLSVDFRQILRSFCRSSFRSFVRCILEVVCSPYHLCTWIGRTSPNPDFVRPVEVFQGFFDIAHPCRHDESVVERSTIIQKSFEKIKFSSKNRSEIVEISGLRPNFTKNASERAMGVLPDVPGATPSEPEAPQERPGRAQGASQNVPRASRSAPEASAERPGSVPGASRGVPGRPGTSRVQSSNPNCLI